MVALRGRLIAGSLALVVGLTTSARWLLAQAPGAAPLGPLPAYGGAYGPPFNGGPFNPAVAQPDPRVTPYSGTTNFGGPATGETIVTEVRIEGNRTTSVSKMPQLRTRQGQPFDPNMVKEDVRALASSKKFIDVKSQFQPVPGGMVVIFQVVERPTLEYIWMVGNQDVRTGTLRKKSELEKGSALDPYAVEEARRRIEADYQEKGYNHPQVTAIEGTKPGDRGVVFMINEGQKQKVWWTSFEGNTIANDARLRTQVSIKPGVMWLFGGKVNRKKIDEDVQKLTAYYRGLGFFKAKISPDLSYNESKSWLTLKYIINEGPRYSIRSVSFLGNEKFQVGELNKNLEQIAGKPFNQAALDRDLAGIRDVYGSQGHVFADVQAETNLAEDKPEMDLVYKIGEGKQYRIGRININITGEDPHTKHSTILNRMSLQPNDIVNTKKLREDERRLRFSSIFNVDPTKGGPPKIAIQRRDDDDEDRAIADSNGGTRGGRAADGYRGQSPDDVETLDVAEVCDSNGQNYLVFVPRSSLSRRHSDGAVQQVRFQNSGTGYAGPGWGVPSGSSTPSYLPPGAQPRPAYGATSPYPPAIYSAPPAGAVPNASFAPNTGYPSQTIPPVTSNYQQSSQPAVAPPVFGQPPNGGVTGPYGQSSAPPTYTQQPMFPAGGGNAFGQGYSPDGSSPYVTAPPSNLPQEGSPYGGGAGSNIFGSPGPFVDLNIGAAETQTGRLMIGAGINSDAGLVGNFVLDEQNFDIRRLPRSWEDIRNGTAWRGAGERLRIEANPGTVVQRYAATYQVPYLFGTQLQFSTSGFYFTRIYQDWSEGRVGGKVQLGYAFTPDFTVRFGFNGERVDIYDPAVPTPPELARALGENDRYGFPIGFAHDTRDSPFLPTQGHLISADFEQVVGSFKYPRVNLEGRQYFLLRQRADSSGRHVIGLGGEFAVTGDDTPIYDNYFAGGFSTLRGFAFRGASPLVGGVQVGGQMMLLGTVEYMFPITADDALRGVVFCDFGTVEKTVALTADQFRVAPGFGLRITVPAMGPAPIALDFAFPVANAPGDQIQNFSFFIGVGR